LASFAIGRERRRYERRGRPRVRSSARPRAPRPLSPSPPSPALDRAGAAFVDAVEKLVALAAEDVVVRQLRAALARTARRLNALDHVVLPGIAGDIRAISSALEEEERDEATRRRTVSH
jgi:V/A-type H+-transporting ATPase subunit D